VGGLRFVVKQLGPGPQYVAEAEDGRGGDYQIRGHASGQLVLEDRAGVESMHESIDAAETAAGQMNRKRYPLKVPKLSWKNYSWREPLFRSRRYNVNEMQIAQACDVPFLGTGHFTTQGRISRDGKTLAAPAHRLQWSGAIGDASQGASVVPALATACGYMDPYGARGGGHYWRATKAQVADVFRVLIKAANAGRKLYRAFPVMHGAALHLPGAQRQVAAWDAWLADARQLQHWRNWKKKDYPEKFKGLLGYHYVGQALFLPQEVIANLKSGKLKYGKLARHEEAHAGLHDVGSRAREISREAMTPSYWKRTEYPAAFVDVYQHPSEETMATLRGSKHKVKPQVRKDPYALVEIVEYNDGDKPYVKSLGYFRPLSNAELNLMWHPHKGKLDVRVHPQTWLTRVPFEHELPAQVRMEQMFLDIPPLV
jgi:hypothetical protein